MAATNEVVSAAQLPILLYVFGAVILLLPALAYLLLPRSREEPSDIESVLGRVQEIVQQATGVLNVSVWFNDHRFIYRETVVFENLFPSHALTLFVVTLSLI